jgi:hypothetical protein
MTLPDPPAGRADAASTVFELFRQVHAALRIEVQGLDGEALNWEPCPGANSIATLIVHLLGSEAETVRAVAGEVVTRHREAEFRGPPRSGAMLAQALDEADQLLGEMAALIDHDRLQALLSLPTLSASDRRTGLTWLVGNYGHAREHLGHVQLTRQLRQR